MWKLAIQPFEKTNVPIDELAGVGPARAKLLQDNGISTIFDLIIDFPTRYVHRKTAIPIIDLEDDEDSTVVGKVVSSNFNRKGRLGTLRVNIRDDSGKARLIFFNAPGWLAANFEKGCEVLVWGKVKFEKDGALFIHPDYEFTSEGDSKIIPLYRTLEDNSGAKIGQKLRRTLLHRAFERFEAFYDPVPPDIIVEMNLPELREAIEKLHFPESYEDMEIARRRLAFDELLFLQLIFSQRRYRAKTDDASPMISPAGKYSQMLQSLPFDLTNGQNIALSKIMENLLSQGRSAMLLSGDVASGKTIVALFAAIAATDSGCQTAIIVPSLLVARQHADNIVQLTREINLSVGLLTGESQKPELYNAMISGEVDIVVGTQALLSENVAFKRLGMVIIDEQHLLGVEQRMKLPEREGTHVLLLSATPIPRSTALALFGDLDLVEIEGYPKARAGTTTYLRKSKKRDVIWDFIEERIDAGEGAFVVFPRIEGDDFSALEFGFEKLQNRFGERVGYIHGGFKEADKNAAIAKFRSGETSILAATTVISVGIDIPEATVVVIESADSFGLAQLHQLRGRVGRSNKEGYCILITDKPKRSRSAQRLMRFASTENGYEVAKIDLEDRGEGEILNLTQSGKNDLMFAKPLKMPQLLEYARATAEKIIKEDPELKKHKNAGLRQSIYYIYDAGEVVRSGV